MSDLQWDFFITDQCNHKCVYCPIAKGDYVMSYGEIENHLRNIKYHEGTISISGGEPLLHWDKVTYLLDFIKKHNAKSNAFADIKLRLYTNGSLLTPFIIEELEKTKVEICVTFDAYHNDRTRPHKSGLRLSSRYEKMMQEYGNKIHWIYSITPAFGKDLHYIPAWFKQYNITNVEYSLIKMPVNDTRYYWTEDTVNETIKSHKLFLQLNSDSENNLLNLFNSTNCYDNKFFLVGNNTYKCYGHYRSFTKMDWFILNKSNKYCCKYENINPNILDMLVKGLMNNIEEVKEDMLDNCTV